MSIIAYASDYHAMPTNLASGVSVAIRWRLLHPETYWILLYVCAPRQVCRCLSQDRCPSQVTVPKTFADTGVRVTNHLQLPAPILHGPSIEGNVRTHRFCLFIWVLIRP